MYYVVFNNNFLFPIFRELKPGSETPWEQYIHVVSFHNPLTMSLMNFNFAVSLRIGSCCSFSNFLLNWTHSTIALDVHITVTAMLSGIVKEWLHCQLILTTQGKRFSGQAFFLLASHY